MSASSRKSPDWQKLKAHAYANLLPMMNDAEYASLRDSISSAGRLTDPIVLYKGAILDGRNRYRACLELQITPDVVQFDGDDQAALDLVYARANHRNMTDSQKAAAAVGFMSLFRRANRERRRNPSQALVPTTPRTVEGRSRDEMGDWLRSQDRTVVFERYRTAVLSDPKSEYAGQSLHSMIAQLLDCWYGTNGTKRSRDQAGTLFGVSGRYVSDAELVAKHDPTLFREVFEGRLPITRAKRAIQTTQRRRELQRKAKAAPPVGDCKIVAGDCLKLLETIPSRSARLVIADPPYNIGIDYGQGAKADQLPRSTYLAMLAACISECQRILTADGSLWLIIDASYLADVECIIGPNRAFPDGMLPGMGLHRRNVIAWHETFGSHQSGNFTRAWRPILYYTVSADDYVWHGDQILIPSARLAEYGDKRADPAGKVPTNVWDFPRVVGNAAERDPSGFSTQLPLALTDRIVRVASDPGDLVVDPFVGSGTSAISAVLHGRRFQGFELDRKRAAAAEQRVRAVVAERSAS